MRKSPGGDGDVLDRRSRLFGHLGPLAVLAITAPSRYVGRHANPDPSGGHQTIGSADARMRESVSGCKSWVTEERRQERPRSAVAEVAEKFMAQKVEGADA